MASVMTPQLCWSVSAAESRYLLIMLTHWSAIAAMICLLHSTASRYKFYNIIYCECPFFWNTLQHIGAHLFHTVAMSPVIWPITISIYKKNILFLCQKIQRLSKRLCCCHDYSTNILPIRIQWSDSISQIPPIKFRRLNSTDQIPPINFDRSDSTNQITLARFRWSDSTGQILPLRFQRSDSTNQTSPFKFHQSDSANYIQSWNLLNLIDTLNDNCFSRAYQNKYGPMRNHRPLLWRDLWAHPDG